VRARRAAALAAGLAVSLAACGGGGDGGDDAAGRAPATTAETPRPAGTEGDGVLAADNTRTGDGVEFVTTPPTTTTSTTTTSTTTTTLPPTTTMTSTTTTTSTTSTSTTTSTTTTSTSTTTTLPPTSTTVPPAVRCSFSADALFEPGAATLTDEAIAELTALAGQLGADVRSVRVEGRTDHRGSDDENLALSEARADAAAQALADAGIDPALITSVGLGEVDAHQPSAAGTPSDDEMAQDRRVDILIDADVESLTASCSAPP